MSIDEMPSGTYDAITYPPTREQWEAMKKEIEDIKKEIEDIKNERERKAYNSCILNVPRY